MDTKLEGTRLSRNKLWHVAMKDGRPRIIKKKGKSNETLISHTRVLMNNERKQRESFPATFGTRGRRWSKRKLVHPKVVGAII
jgi:hypothetical protein